MIYINDKNNIDVFIKNEIKNISDMCSSISISDKNSFNFIADNYTKIKSWIDSLENKRKELISPAKKEISEINSFFNEIIINCEYIIEIINEKINLYYNSLVNDHMEKNNRIIESAKILNLDNEIILENFNLKLESNNAKIYKINRKKFQVLNFDIIPKKYLKIDEEKIKTDLDFGVNEIPGIKITEETKISIRRK